jgi:hypothetical protein
MIRHQAVAGDLKTVMFDITSQEIEVLKAVQIAEEHVFATITPLGHMMRYSGYNRSGNSRHVKIIQKRKMMSSKIGGVSIIYVLHHPHPNPIRHER